MAGFDTPVRTGTGRVNLVPAPSFQFSSGPNGNGWGTEGGCTSAINTTTQYRGSQSLQLTATAAAQMTIWGYYATNPASVQGPIPVTAGTTYTFTAYCRAGNAGGANRTVQLLLSWQPATLVPSASTSGTATAITQGGWTQVFVTGVAPAGTTNASVRILAAAGTTGDIVLVDGVMLEPTAQALPYFDGTLDGGRWTGTVENSASYSYGVDAGGGLVQNVRTPLLPSDAANKSYVDGVSAGGVRTSGVSKRVNFILNPSFETGIANWTRISGLTATPTNSPSYSYSGANCLSFKASTANSAIGVYTNVTGLSPSTVYTFSFYVMSDTQNIAVVTPSVITYNGIGAVVAASVNGTTGIARNFAWTRVSQTFTTGATAVAAQLTVSVAAVATTDRFVLDAVMLEAGSTAGTYFDGSVGTARWTGTVGASPSEQLALDANTATIANVATPTFAADAANKSYVDSVAMTTSPNLGPAVKRVNYVTNPSFELGTFVGWATSRGFLAAPQITTLPAATTGYVLGAVTNSTYGTGAAVVSSPLFPIPTPSVGYVASFYSAFQYTGVSITPGLLFYDINGTQVGSFSGTAAVNSAIGGPGVRYSVGGTAPATAVSAQITVSFPFAGYNDYTYLDSFLLEQQSITSPPGAYFDGSTTGYRWAGTANLSTSETTLSAQTMAVTNLATPVLGTDAATKAYVDTATPVSFGRFALSATSTYNTNLMPNPGFETGAFPGWTTTFANLFSAGSPYQGSACLQVQTTSTASVTSPVMNNVIGGANYYLSFAFKTTTTARVINAAVTWLGPTGLVVSSSASGGIATETATWQIAGLGFVAPALAKSAQVTFTWTSNASSENHFLDAIMFEPGTVRSGYFDGDSPGWRWTGAQYLSQSETYTTNLNNYPLQNVADPYQAQDAATRNYVDTKHVTHPRVQVTQAYAYNLFPNASIANGQTIWGSYTASTTVGLQNNQVYDGNYAMLLSAQAAGDRAAASNTALMPVTPGQNYSGALMVRAAATARTARLDIQWYNAAKALISTTAGPTGIVDSTSVWVQTYTGTLGAPVNAFYAALVITFVNCAVNEVHYFDYAVFQVGANAQTAAPADPTMSAAYRYQAAILTGGTETYAFDANSNPIINIGTPVAATDGTNKAYVDGKADLFRATQVLAATATQVDFYLPPGARNANIRWIGRSTDTAASTGVSQHYFRVNGSSSANYNWMGSYSQGVLAASPSNGTTTSAPLGYIANGYFTSARSGSGILELYGLDATGTDGLHFLIRSECFSSTAAQWMFTGAGVVALTAPWLQISLFPGAGSWGIGSQFSLICE